MGPELSEYLIPITVAAMVLTIMFDARIAFMGITSIILLVTILIGNNLEFMVTAMFNSSIGIYAVRQLRQRRQFFTAIFSLLGSRTFPPADLNTASPAAVSHSIVGPNLG